ncbi:hypothetical protein H9P43_001837 [Blastocladiella emersonii ATCC 22665]|nr:hypothetical protein H9P43_001837 [Blastocladiella emersonii ATCC 22665]
MTAASGSGTIVGSGSVLPTTKWADGLLFTPLTRELKPFLLATRNLTWAEDQIDAWFDIQEKDAPEGPRRRMFALWIPAADWDAGLAAYEVVNGPGRVVKSSDGTSVEGVDLRAACATLRTDEDLWRPVATVAIEYENLDYGLDVFGGDADLMRRAYACRETATAAGSMLATLPPFARLGCGVACLEFAERHVMAQGRGCGDETLPVIRRAATAAPSSDERLARLYTRQGCTREFVGRVYWGEASFYVKDLAPIGETVRAASQEQAAVQVRASPVSVANTKQKNMTFCAPIHVPTVQAQSQSQSQSQMQSQWGNHHGDVAQTQSQSQSQSQWSHGHGDAFMSQSQSQFQAGGHNSVDGVFVGGNPDTWSPSTNDVFVGGNPDTWAPSSSSDGFVGGDPATWAPANDAGFVGGNPDTWAPSDDLVSSCLF